VKIDYLWSADETAHAINCSIEETVLVVGILCLVSRQQDTIRIANESHSFLVDVPSEFRSGHERVKVFNAVLNILDHEQIQLPSGNQD
jgi:hypothetical protein